VSYIRDGALVATQRRNLGLDMPMIGSTSFVVPSLLDLVTPDDLKNTYSMIDAILGEPMGAKSVDYMQRFAARFGMRADPFGSCYYDAAMILADAMRKVGTDKTKIRDYFAGVKDTKGVTRIWTTDSLGDMAHSVALVDFVPGTKDLKLVSYYPPAA
jgi:branched-chain amino acid transport system substrate-binding protein